MVTLKERDGLICGICKKPLDSEWSEYESWRLYRSMKRLNVNINVDHVLPRSKGGGRTHITNINNLSLTHRRCNTEKGNFYDK